MRIISFLAGLLFLVFWGSLITWIPESVDIVRVYQEKMQVALFTGFLTIGGFLLTLKTFILIKLKEGLYDHEEYKKRVEINKAKNPDITFYGPLKRLGSFLVYGVASAIITSLSQLTIGFIESRIAVTFCMSMGLLTGTLVVASWWLIKSSLNDWFDVLEPRK